MALCYTIEVVIVYILSIWYASYVLFPVEFNISGIETNILAIRNSKT